MKNLIILFLLVTHACIAQFNPIFFYKSSSRVAPVLDSYPGAKVAFSLRKVRTAYSGNCLRVRRSSDNAESDIGFNSTGSIDSVSLLSFVGANDGFVTKWYDQSGNSLDAFQTINANQPRIVLAGVIESINGNPSIRFDQTLATYMKVGLFSFTTASAFSVGNYLTGNNNSRFLAMSPVGAFDTGSTQDCFTFASNAIRSNFRSLNASGGGALGHQIISQIVTTTRADGYRNDILMASDTAITSSLCTPGAISISRNGDADTGSAVQYMQGYLKELIFYDSDKTTDRIAIQNNLNQYYKVY